jgi:hypothetical protein
LTTQDGDPLDQGSGKGDTAKNSALPPVAP